MDKSEKIIVGISVGDTNGIGIEVILKTFEDKRMLEFCTPVLFASNKLVNIHKKKLGLHNNIHGINTITKLAHDKINLFNSWQEDVNVSFGELTKEGGISALKSLKKATDLLQENKIDVLVTAPIHKENIQSESFNFPGHTEYLEAKFKGKSLMILMTETLKIGLITGHIPVSEVPKTINEQLITEKATILHQTLIQDFGIAKPKIAILGLNPHCGDNGVIGKEEETIIKPTIQKIRNTGKLVFGPYASDGFFGAKTYEQFDAVLAMYHDQGLAPFKALSFGNGVNFTAGLNIVRTSPDHGTGFDIAGKNTANPESFKEALFSAISIYKNRKQHIEYSTNALKIK